jgi:hypothetical protein
VAGFSLSAGTSEIRIRAERKLGEMIKAQKKTGGQNTRTIRLGARYPEWQRPKGMHWNTFEQLPAQHDAFVAISLSGMAAWLNLFGESLDDWI